MHVAVGVILDQYQNILIAERPLNKTKAGFWEFPGGKVEEGETVLEALKRELQEEIGILVDSATHLINVDYHNQDCDVLLDTWMVTAYTGEPSGLEGQIIRWVNISELGDYTFPEGNRKIIEKLKNSDYLIIDPS